MFSHNEHDEHNEQEEGDGVNKQVEQVQGIYSDGGRIPFLIRIKRVRPVKEDRETTDDNLPVVYNAVIAAVNEDKETFATTGFLLSKRPKGEAKKDEQKGEEWEVVASQIIEESSPLFNDNGSLSGAVSSFIQNTDEALEKTKKMGMLMAFLRHGIDPTQLKGSYEESSAGFATMAADESVRQMAESSNTNVRDLFLSQSPMSMNGALNEMIKSSSNPEESEEVIRMFFDALEDIGAVRKEGLEKTESIDSKELLENGKTVSQEKVEQLQRDREERINQQREVIRRHGLNRARKLARKMRITLEPEAVRPFEKRSEKKEA